MVEVVARERADAVGAQELVLVEQVGEDSPQLRLVEERREQPAPPLADVALARGRDLGGELRVPLDGSSAMRSMSLRVPGRRLSARTP